ncbi:hypothetical protein FA13DRAFT_1798622 [Coprinellus micaceus]|uniref:Uncharacterized protein n=1 Tax=Coprinellus micaceus TaxID=71717 RepID=A0A4Y7SLK3_COPMI|nr:hypothetical protein FA13DRAFT_1798622 [Coprinellus micaceus]
MAKKLKLDDTLLKADVGDDELANPKVYTNDYRRDPLLPDAKEDDFVFQATDFRDCETDEGNPLIDIFGISKVCRASYLITCRTVAP